MRVSGLPDDACQAIVHDVADAGMRNGSAGMRNGSWPEPSEPCHREVFGHDYSFCSPVPDRAVCQEASTDHGLAGCMLVGSPPEFHDVDPFCWVYDERRNMFEPWALASSVGLL